MKIFDKRPLSLILCIMLGSFVIFNSYGLFVFIIPTFLFILSLIKPCGKYIKNNFAKLLSALSLIAIFASFIYFDIYFPAYDRFKGESVITGTVTDISDNTYNNRITIKTDNINDKLFSSYKINVYLDKDEYYNYSIGSKIEIVGEIVSPSTSNVNETYYTSKGISGIVTEVNGYKLIEVGDFTLEYRINSYRKALSRNIIMKTNPEVGGFLAALLLGEKEYLPPQANLDFLRLGISHVLALSGTHLVILAIGFSKLLMKIGLSKKPAIVIRIIFTIMYMAITGFSASVTRSGIMLIISSLLFLLSSSRDSMTSLFLSVAIMCIITPYSIYDLGLWLSAFATLGIVVMEEYEITSSLPVVIKAIVISILATLFATATTAFIIFLKFDGTSLFSVIATLVFSVITEIFIYAGVLLLLIGNIKLIQYFTILIGNVTLGLADLFAKIPGVYISTNFTSVKIFVTVFSILIFAFFVIEVKRKKLITLILFIIMMGAFILSATLTYHEESKTKIVYHNDSSEQITIIDRGEITIIDIANYDESKAFQAYNKIVHNKLSHADNYILTHYSYNLDEYCEKLLSIIEIKNIYLPKPHNATEEKMSESINALREKFRINIYFYSESTSLKFKDIEFKHIFSSNLDEGKKLMFSITYNNRILTYTTTSMLSAETKSMASEILANSNTIIFGCHVKSSYNLTQDFVFADTVIFSNPNVEMNSDIYYSYQQRNVYFNIKKMVLTH